MFDTKLSPQQQPPVLAPSPTLIPLDFPVTCIEDLTINYLTQIFEVFLDAVFPAHGFILLNSKGEHIQSSPYARQLCLNLEHQGTHHKQCPIRPNIALPSEFQRVTQCLIESREDFPSQKIQLQDEIVLTDKTRVYVQANWIDLALPETSCIVLILENHTEVIRQKVLEDARRYGFTKQETKVWELKMLGLSRKAIGQELFIEVNTVKKHIKQINAKRQNDCN